MEQNSSICGSGRCRLRLVVAAGLILGIILAGSYLRRTERADLISTNASREDLLKAMARGESRAVEQARATWGQDSEQILALASAALGQESWRARAAGCDLLAGRDDTRAVALLVARVSDAEGRVRMRAIGALASLHPPPVSLPQKFTPIDRRDEWLLAWLDDYAARKGSSLSQDLCEVYAGAARVEFGKPLAERCLSCHAGRTRAAFSANDRCAQCHPGIYAQWAASAHAQSLSHLHLATPVEGGVQYMDFGEIRGIGCSECHPVTGQRSFDAAGAASGRLVCAYEFEPVSSPASSCARCHREMYEEWLRWRSTPHPRRPEWPPGQLDMGVVDDERTCIDCHMRSAPSDQPGLLRDHRWAARRDRQFLREAVDVRVVPASESGSAQLIVTNLAGHAFPTGTRRRAIHLYAGTTADGDPPLVLTLSPDRLGISDGGSHSVLVPGEQRVITIPLPAGADEVTYRMEYVRDRFTPGSYTIDILSGSRRLRGPLMFPLSGFGPGPEN